MISNKSTNDYLQEVKDKCIDCGKCTKCCPFLTKYKINLKDFADRQDLAFSCFLCQKCKAVCPVDLDGKKISLILRKQNPKFESVKKQKENYFFKNKSKRKTKDLLYLGCNFPAFYPDTTKYLMELFNKEGFDYSIDCCNLPSDYTGFENNYMERFEKELKDKEVERIVCVCPNCFHKFYKNLSVEVITIFKWLEERDMIQDIDEEVNVFFPCSDRYNHIIFEEIKRHIKGFNNKYISTNCCGAGGIAGKSEKDIATQMQNSIKNEKIYTYCATCSSKFVVNNEVHHFVSKMVGIDEKCDPSFFKNALKGKFRGRK